MNYVIFLELTAWFTEISQMLGWLRNAQTCLQCVFVCVCVCVFV